MNEGVRDQFGCNALTGVSANALQSPYSPPLRGLRAELPFHFWVAYEDAQGKMSKPSKPLTTTLKDTFKEK